jgi:hypothetical protein
MSEIKGFENLNYRKYNQNQLIAIEEDGRGCIALCGSETSVTQAISDEYCGIPVKVIDTEFRKHNDELVVTVELTEDDGEICVRDFELKTLAFYP